MTLTQQLRQQIKSEVTKVTESSSPHVYQRSSTKDGYSKLEDDIIAMMLAQNIIVTTAINIIESDEL